MDSKTIEQLATNLNDARLNTSPVEQLSGEHKEFSRKDAYLIQKQGVKLRESLGEKVIGLKMGLTSEAKRKQMDLDSPLYGHLTDKMQCPNGGVYSMARQIHPKIEPEIAFLFNKPLKGKVTREEVLDACEAVCACMEILDSRYKQFKYFSMEDVISDNSSSSHFVLGEWIKDFRDIDLINLKMEMKVNGQVAQTGVSSAISGDPVISIIQQCELLEQFDEGIEPGQFVLAGAATTAVALEPGMEVSLDVEKLGSVLLSISE